MLPQIPEPALLYSLDEKNQTNNFNGKKVSGDTDCITMYQYEIGPV